MHLDQFTHLWFSNIGSIINILGIATLLLLFVAMLFSFKKGKDEETGQSFSDLESTLKRVLENTEVRATAVKGASVSVAPSSDGGAASVSVGDSGDADALKTELAEKEVQIMTLHDQVSELKKGGGAPSEELETKLKDLESKLQEYEIIEDDIANLSLYKQENAKLKKEIEDLKSSGAASPEAPAAVAPVDVPAPAEEKTEEPDPVAEAAAPEDDIMAEFAAAVDQQKSVEAVDEESPKEESVDDTMDEFAAAVAEQKATEAGGDTPEAEPENDTMDEFAAAVAEQKAAEAGEETPEAEPETDTMDEFAAAVAEQKAAEAGEETPEADPETDTMDEFAAAVAEQKAEEAGSSPEDPKASETPESTSNEESEEDDDEGDDDLGLGGIGVAPTESDGLMAEFEDRGTEEAPQVEEAVVAETPVEPEVIESEPAASEPDAEPVEDEKKQETAVEDGEATEPAVATEDVETDSKAVDESEEVDLGSLIDPEDILGEDDDDNAAEESPAQANDEVAAETAEDATPLADSVLSDDTVSAFNKSVEEHREIRKEKEEEMAKKMSEIGIGKDVKETVTDSDMLKFRNAVEHKTEDGAVEPDFLSSQTDADKILDEVSGLAESVEATGDSADDPDSGSKLIEEFEAFTEEDKS